MDFSQYGEPCEEWQAFVQQYPAAAKDGFPVAGQTVEELQQQVNSTREQAALKLMQTDQLEDKVDIKDHVVQTRDGSSITVRSYQPMATVKLRGAYVYYHGGGYLFGSLDSERYLCSLTAFKLEVMVLHVCQRHAPAFTHPTQHDDAWDSFVWITDNVVALGIDGLKVVMGGLSAGGCLSASVVAREIERCKASGTLERMRIQGLVLGIPWLVHRDNYPLHLFANAQKASQKQCADAPLLPQERYDLFTELLRAEDPKDPMLNVALADEDVIRAMPPTALLVAGRDMLRDEALYFGRRLKDAGIATKVHIFPGLPHGFRRYQDLPSARRFDQLVLDSTQWALDRGETQQQWVIEN